MTKENMFQTLLKSHRVGSVLGINVRIMYILYILMGLLIFPALLSVPKNPLVIFDILALLSLPFCVFLHEMGHSLAAMKDGIPVPQITLTPLGGMAQIGSIPSPESELMIALAGPCVSLLLAGLAFIPIYIFGESHGVFIFFQVNMMLALFNLLPAFPMDGGRVTLALLVMKYGSDRAFPIMTKVSKVTFILMFAFGLLLVFSGNFSGVFLMAISASLHMSGQQEMHARWYAERYVHNNGAFRTQNIFPQNSSYNNVGTDKKGFIATWFEKRRIKRAAREAQEKQALEEEVNRILDKVNTEGLAGLNDRERDMLNKASQKYRK